MSTIAFIIILVVAITVLACNYVSNMDLSESFVDEILGNSTPSAKPHFRATFPHIPQTQASVIPPKEAKVLNASEKETERLRLMALKTPEELKTIQDRRNSFQLIVNPNYVEKRTKKQGNR